MTDANGTALTAHSPSIGGAWSLLTTPGFTIQGNECQLAANGTLVKASNAATPPTADYDVSADFKLYATGWSDSAGVFGRLTGVGGYGYLAAVDIDSSTWYLFDYAAGSFSTLGAPWVDSWSSGTRRATLHMVGVSVSVLVDGVSRIAATNAAYSVAGKAGLYRDGGVATALTFDNVIGGPPAVAGTHIVTGRGNFTVGTCSWLSVSLSAHAVQSKGNAEPPNYFHLGQLSWATANGAMVAYPVTRDLDLVQLPAGMRKVYYQFAPGLTATIVELTSP